MHRSGTSSIAGALHGLGAHLGPTEHLMKPRVDNPDGFFEHQLLTDLNDEILTAFQGSWHEPPALPDGWETAAILEDLRERAARLLQEDFGSAPTWGWKDPRTCLTLAFWQPLLPAARYVLCLRSPLDVARSLHLRDGFSIEKGVGLWVRHMASAVWHASSSPTLVIGYNDFVDHPDTEIARLAAFIEGAAAGTPDAQARARAVVNDRLRHHRTALTDVFASRDTSYAASTLYAALSLWLDLQRGALCEKELASVSRLLAINAPRAHDEAVASHGLTKEVADLNRLQSAREAAVLAARQDAEGARAALAETRAHLETVQGAADVDRLRLRLEIAARTDAQARAACLEEALANAEIERSRLEETRANAEIERSRLEALLHYLETPVGATKIALRAWVPRRVHALLRRWGARLLPRLLLNKRPISYRTDPR